MIGCWSAVLSQVPVPQSPSSQQVRAQVPRQVRPAAQGALASQGAQIGVVAGGE